jgi:hypothetical protein
VASQGGNSKEARRARADSLFTSTAEQVCHHHAALGIGVHNSNTLATSGSDDLIAHVRVTPDTVAHKRQESDNAHIAWLHDRNRQELFDNITPSSFGVKSNATNLRVNQRATNLHRMHAHLEQAQCVHKASNSRGTAFVTMHTRHHSTGLNISTASVIRDALANKIKTLLDAGRLTPT